LLLGGSISWNQPNRLTPKIFALVTTEKTGIHPLDDLLVVALFMPEMDRTFCSVAS